MILAKRIDLARYARMLRRLVAGQPGVALCATDGSWLWSDGVEGGRERFEPFFDAIADDLNEPGASLWGELRLSWAPVRDAQGAVLAWLVMAQHNAEEPPPGLEEALLDVAAGIEREAVLHQEITSLSTELGQRQEEVNLVYGIEERAQALARGALGARELLVDFAHCLQVEIVALQLGDRFTYGIRDVSAVPNYDLVLSELKNHLGPFLAISRKPFILNEPGDVRREYLFANLPYRVLAFPVRLEDRLQATLFLVRSGGAPVFTNGDRGLAGVIASQAARILLSRGMVEDLRRFGDQLANALIRAVEAKDPYTRGHSERVQVIARQLAAGAELPVGDVESVGWGALLHDVGKIGVPDRILCKAGKLTDEEYTLVQTHPERSYDILRHIEQIDPRALNAARYHHEKFDGSGYPHGLRGLEIPVHARVTAVADTYDAITSSRAYRPGATHEKALEITASCAGSQLDPGIVQVFERMCGEGRDWLPNSHGVDADE